MYGTGNIHLTGAVDPDPVGSADPDPDTERQTNRPLRRPGYFLSKVGACWIHIGMLHQINPKNVNCNLQFLKAKPGTGYGSRFAKILSSGSSTLHIILLWDADS